MKRLVDFERWSLKAFSWFYYPDTDTLAFTRVTPEASVLPAGGFPEVYPVTGFKKSCHDAESPCSRRCVENWFRGLLVITVITGFAMLSGG